MKLSSSVPIDVYYVRIGVSLSFSRSTVLLIAIRPRFLAGEGAQEAYRDFGSLHDLAAAQQTFHAVRN